ncbi:hypothetical protein ACFLVS_00285 [Chloroflexota bacterium]
MKKIRKTTLMVIAGGIVAVIVAIMGMTYFQHDSEQTELKDKIDVAQLKLNKYTAELNSAQKEQMEKRLTAAELQLINSKVSLSQSIESIEASGILFDFAEDYNLEITELSSIGIERQPIDRVNMLVLPVTATVEGDVLDLIDFINKWTSEYSTGRVESVEIAVVEALEVEEGTEETGEVEWSATITLFIFTHKDD